MPVISLNSEHMILERAKSLPETFVSKRYINNRLRFSTSDSLGEMKQEVPDVSMEDSVAAKIDLVQGEDVLRIVVRDAYQCREFPLEGLLREEQVGDLDVEFPISPCADEIDFPFPDLSYGNLISMTQNLHQDDVFQGGFDLSLVVAEKGLADAVVGKIILLVDGKHFLADKIRPRNLIKQKSSLTGV